MILKPEAVRVLAGTSSKKRLMQELGMIAEAAYGGGAINIMELIDAYRTELDTWRTFIDRALDARETFIQLQRLRGD